MKQYIERSELVSRIYKYVELTNPEEQEWVKDECIRQAHAMPSVNVGEWISVDERLPERNGRYMTHCKIEGKSLVCILYYCNVGGFNEGTVTHWMPLPEPPKGD